MTVRPELAAIVLAGVAAGVTLALTAPGRRPVRYLPALELIHYKPSALRLATNVATDPRTAGATYPATD